MTDHETSFSDIDHSKELHTSRRSVAHPASMHFSLRLGAHGFLVQANGVQYPHVSIMQKTGMSKFSPHGEVLRT
jgi:hypothetical protein